MTWKKFKQRQKYQNCILILVNHGIKVEIRFEINLGSRSNHSAIKSNADKYPVENVGFVCFRDIKSFRSASETGSLAFMWIVGSTALPMNISLSNSHDETMFMNGKGEIWRWTRGCRQGRGGRGPVPQGLQLAGTDAQDTRIPPDHQIRLLQLSGRPDIWLFGYHQDWRVAIQKCKLGRMSEFNTRVLTHFI